MLKIRFAQPADQESILRIYVSVAQAISQPDTYWEQLIRAERLLVAQLNDRIIGFGGIDVTAGEQLKWLYLLPEHQRAGVGSKLLQRLETLAWEAGIRFLRLHSAPAAVEFYQRHGYRAILKEAPGKYDHDGVEMEKEISCERPRENY